MPAFKDLTGQRFGRLTVIERAPSRTTGSKPVTMWRCRCDCGKITTVSSGSLERKTTVSCGCKKRKHGFSHKERLYETWKNMRRRCSDPTNKRWEQYGGKGIKVCAEWSDYAAFRAWAMANGYADNLTIDRIDPNGNYCPENCRWVTQKEQMNNMTTNRRLAYGGKTMTVAQWATALGVAPKTLECRLLRGWSIERALSQPVRIVRR